jgi:hypothetical protein
LVKEKAVCIEVDDSDVLLEFNHGSLTQRSELPHIVGVFHTHWVLEDLTT